MQTISHKGPDAEEDKLRCLQDTDAHSRRTGWSTVRCCQMTWRRLSAHCELAYLLPRARAVHRCASWMS
ncbi:hypothetical protein IG631_00458 [Alternaria alternata]|nr:hypothetical protein IG631_00458 [Alternaria alternata]